MMRLWLDSGAYSAWRLGVCIDLDEYIGFLQRHGAGFHCYFSLDVIPGEYGHLETRPDRIEVAARRSYANHCKMRQVGLTPIPVLHSVESIDWMRRYLDAGEQVVALSIKGTYSMLKWLDQCFDLLKHYPNVRTHGLSATSIAILGRFQFDSVDSSTWLFQSKVGQVPVPRYSNGRPDYRRRPLLMAVTNGATERDNHETGKRDFERELIAKHFNAIGVTLAQVRDDHHQRWRCWLHYFRGVQQTIKTHIVPVSNATQYEKELLLAFDFNRTMVSFFRLKSNRAYR
jgi:hypothetical protein